MYEYELEKPLFNAHVGLSDSKREEILFDQSTNNNAETAKVSPGHIMN